MFFAMSFFGTVLAMVLAMLEERTRRCLGSRVREYCLCLAMAMAMLGERTLRCLRS